MRSVAEILAERGAGRDLTAAENRRRLVLARCAPGFRHGKRAELPGQSTNAGQAARDRDGANFSDSLFA